MGGEEILAEIDLLLVIGSSNSSNSSRLVELGASVRGRVAPDGRRDRDRRRWLEGVEVVGLTSGASVPEKLVQRVCEWFHARGVTDIAPHRFVEEDIEFRLPFELRRGLVLAHTQASQ